MNMISDDNVFTLPKLHHSYGLIGGALAPLVVGATLYIRSRYSPVDMYYDLIREPITLLFAVPFMYSQLIDVVKQRKNRESKNINLADKTKLRYCFSAGANLSQEVQDAFYELFSIPICIDYGSTENGVICLNLRPLEKKGSVGKIITNSKLMILNEDGKKVLPKETGEIVVSSPNRSRKYAYPNELNDSAFKNGLYYTGDLGYIDEEEYVYLKGKKGRIINVAGKKIDPIEIEEVINMIDGIKECIVVGENNEAKGQELKAYVVADTRKVEREVIIKHCNSKLSAYKVPKKYEFINKIPRNSNGKVLRHEFSRIEGEII